MKRGLVVLDPADVPRSERRDRVGRLQRELGVRGLDGALVYGDVYRSDDIAYLTNLCVYWNEGMLFVPATGEPTFVTKLSARTHPWMRSSSTVEDIRSGRDLAALAAEVLGAAGARTAAMVDASWWPLTLAERLSEATPQCGLRPAEGLVRTHRLLPSESDLALLRRAGAMLGAAVADAREADGDRADLVARAESRVRGAGALDLLACCDPAPDGVVSLDLICQYRHVWAEVARIIAPDDGEASAWVRTTRSGHRAAADALRPGATAGSLSAAAAAELGGLPSGASWQVRCTPHTDIGTRGGYVADPEGRDPGGEAVVSGSVVALAVEVRLTEGDWVTVADTYEVHDGRAERLTAEDDGGPNRKGRP